MKTRMLIYLVSLFLLTHCGDDNETAPPATATVIGKWKIEKLIFETDLTKSEIGLPSTYVVSFTISEDGSYTYTEGGTEKKQSWQFKEETKTLIVKNDDQTESQFAVTFSEDGTSWSYLAYQIDLTSPTLSSAENDIVDFVSLVCLSSDKSLAGASTLNVFFVVKKN